MSLAAAVAQLSLAASSPLLPELPDDVLHARILPFLCLRDAASLRAVSTAMRAAVSGGLLVDRRSVVRDVAAWRRCFPAARAVNVRALLADADVALLQGIRALSLGSCMASTLSDAALARLVPGQLRELRLWGAARRDARIAAALAAAESGGGAPLSVLRADDDGPAAVLAECALVLRTSIDGGNARDQLAVLEKLRRALCIEDSSRVMDAFIAAGLVPELVRHLRQPSAKLQHEALWALTNIVSGSTAQAGAVLAAGALPQFAEMLDSPDKEVREQALWAIGNVAGDSPARRDAVIASAAPAKITALLRLHSKPSFTRQAAWVFSNCFRGKVRDGGSAPPPFPSPHAPQITRRHEAPQLRPLYPPPPHAPARAQPGPSLDAVAQLLPTVVQLLRSSQDEDTLAEATWALAYCTDDCEANEGAQLQLTVESGACARLIELLLHPSADVLTPALRVVGNICTGDAAQTQAVLDAGALEALKQLLLRKSIRLPHMKEACWALSNIMAGSEAQIQAAIDAELPQLLLRILRGDLRGSGRGGSQAEVRREALWAIVNAASRSTPAQICALLRAAVMSQLRRMAVDDEAPNIALLALSGLEKILRAGPAMAEAGQLPLADLMALFEQEGMRDALKRLATRAEHPEWRNISSKASEMLQAFYPAG